MRNETTFNHAGFVTANPVKGRIYLCDNNYIVDFDCPCCGSGGVADSPMWFFHEGHSGLPVCAACALKHGFTLAPEEWNKVLHYVALGARSAPGSYQTAAERETAATEREAEQEAAGVPF